MVYSIGNWMPSSAFYEFANHDNSTCLQPGPSKHWNTYLKAYLSNHDFIARFGAHDRTFQIRWDHKNARLLIFHQMPEVVVLKRLDQTKKIFQFHRSPNFRTALCLVLYLGSWNSNFSRPQFSSRMWVISFIVVDQPLVWRSIEDEVACVKAALIVFLKFKVFAFYQIFNDMVGAQTPIFYFETIPH